MPGPRKTPTPLKLMRGTVSKRAAKAEPQPPAISKIPPAPAHLDEVAREEWARVAHDLISSGILTSVDLGALQTYCIAYSHAVYAELTYQEHLGTVAFTKAGMAVSPYFRAAVDAGNALLKAAAELGMTPASRGKVQAVPVARADEWEAFS